MIQQNDFFIQVWEVVKLIPFGKVTSYGAIARYIGAPGAARTVGYAMNASHKSSISVPAHRVVNRNGLLTGKAHFGGPDVMQQLLESEGHCIENNAIKDFRASFWDPCKEL